MQQYLKLPIRFHHFFERKRLPVCNIESSISYNIHLLITTILGENKQDACYGSSFWDNEFDIQLSQEKLAEIIAKDLQKAIQAFEKRLINVSISVSIKQAEITSPAQKQIKRRIDIRINGNIFRTNEPFNFSSGFFIGPFLFD